MSTRITLRLPKEMVEIAMEEGGGVHSCRKYVEKHSTNLNMLKKALVKKISMLKSNFVEAGHELGYKILILFHLGPSVGHKGPYVLSNASLSLDLYVKGMAKVVMIKTWI